MRHSAVEEFDRLVKRGAIPEVLSQAALIALVRMLDDRLEAIAHPATEDLLEQLLAETRHIRAAVETASSGARSSVEVKTSTRGVDVSCKAYEGSDITAAGDAAMAEYQRVVAAMNGGRSS